MDKGAYEKRIQWFQEARFGMFIHWGLYAIPARGEWVRSTEGITVEDYQVYFDNFDPVDYDPVKWAKLAKAAGMKYAVLTAKHHDGFCLFDSKLTDYKSTNTKAKRDLVAEFLTAFRNEGLKVGLYYSLIDWHHPDFPHFGDRHHPMRDNAAYKDQTHDFDRYLDYMHGQVEELCRDYGKLDILWFDFSYEPLQGEAWRATQLVEMVRRYQPDVMMDNRLEVGGEGFGSLVTENPSDFAGDFVSPEQIIPPDGIVDAKGKPVCWEACVTLNNNWGYAEFDKTYKSAKTVVRKLVECVSKGGNLLLNVGPDAKGRIPRESVEILEEVGRWMDKNGESIYGCGVSGLEKPAYGYITRKNDILYVHVFEDLIGPVPVKGIPQERIALVQNTATGGQLPLINAFTTASYPDYTFIGLGKYETASYPLPDDTDTVLKITLKS